MQYRDSMLTGSNNAVRGAKLPPPPRHQWADSGGFLTPISPIRRFFDATARMVGGLIIVLLLLASSQLDASTTHRHWHAIADITRTAEDFVRASVGMTDKRVTPQAGRLDPRLQLPQCTQDLEAFQQRGARMVSRTVVGVRCNGSHPWKVYVPVDVIVTESVLVAQRTLASGHVFATGDVIAEKRDVSGLIGGYVSKPEYLVGKRLKHQIMAGRVITPSMLMVRIMVHRGQTVTIVARNDAVSIRMMGKALTDGVENQRIRVENTESKRVIEGIVRSPEHVEVLVY